MKDIELLQALLKDQHLNEQEIQRAKNLILSMLREIKRREK